MGLRQLYKVTKYLVDFEIISQLLGFHISPSTLNLNFFLLGSKNLTRQLGMNAE